MARHVLTRLLGAGRPEIDCDGCFDLLDHYVEAELGGGDPELAVPGMAAHLEGCPACAEDYASLRALVALEGGSKGAPARVAKRATKSRSGGAS